MHEMHLMSNHITLGDILISLGFAKEYYGYTKVTEKNTHWVILFANNEVQMYGYKTGDSNMQYIYNTNVLKTVNPDELDCMVKIFLKNYE